MTNEEKQLLLKDLCARLPYGVRICRNRNGEVCDFTLYGIVGERLVSKATYEEKTYSKGIVSKHFETLLYSKLLNIQCNPYLRPMSSMTEEERNEYNDIYQCRCHEKSAIRLTTLCYSHHLDINGLIEKGLAIKAKEGMYNTKK